METYIGIDLGTSGVKVDIINGNGKILFQEIGEYPTFVEDLRSEQNPYDWWTTIINIFKKIPKVLKLNLNAISFSGQMHGMIPIDENNKVIRNAILWNDTRSFQEVNFLNKNPTKEKIVLETGNIAIEGFTAPKILWFKKNENNLFKQTKMFLLPKDWLIYKFSNKLVTEPSDASGTLLYNVKKNKWSKFLVNLIGININQLPTIVPSSSIVSNVSKEVAQLLQISNDVKIIAGGADQAMNAIALNTYNEGDICISLGTSGVVFAPTKIYKVSSNNTLHSFASASKNFYQMGVTLAFGGSIQWFSKNILQNHSFDNNALQKKNSIIYMPYISGERTPLNDAKVSGMFLGLRKEHNGSDMFQAVLEGISFSIFQVYKIMEENLNIKVKNIYVSGGASKSKIVVEALATLFKMRINIVKNNSGPSYGAALMAYAGSKNISLEKIKKINSINYKFEEPNKAQEEYLNKKFLIWKSVNKDTKKISHKIFEDLILNRK